MTLPRAAKPASTARRHDEPVRPHCLQAHLSSSTYSPHSITAPGGTAGVGRVATDVGWLWAEVEASLDGRAPTEAPPRGEARSRREGLPVYGGSLRAPAR